MLWKTQTEAAQGLYFSQTHQVGQWLLLFFVAAMCYIIMWYLQRTAADGGGIESTLEYDLFFLGVNVEHPFERPPSWALVHPLYYNFKLPILRGMNSFCMQTMQTAQQIMVHVQTPQYWHICALLVIEKNDDDFCNTMETKRFARYYIFITEQCKPYPNIETKKSLSCSDI